MGSAATFVLVCLGIGVVLTLILRLFLSTPIAPAGFRRIQRAAFENIIEEKDAGRWSEEQQALVRRRQYVQTEEGFGLFYTISRAKGLYIHRVTAQGRGPRPSERRALELCLVLMAVLRRQLRQFPKQARPRVRMARSPLGTHHLAFELTEEQHEQLHARLAAADPGG